MVSILLACINQLFTITREQGRLRYRAWRSLSDANVQIRAADMSAAEAEDGILVSKYQRSRRASVQVQYAGGLLSDDRPGLPTYSLYSTVSTGGLFTCTAPVAPIS